MNDRLRIIFSLAALGFAALTGFAVHEVLSPGMCAMGHAIHAGLAVFGSFMVWSCLKSALPPAKAHVAIADLKA